MPIGSLLGGLISQGGNQAAAGQAQQGGQTAFNQGQNVAGLDRAIQSPWVQAGTAAAGQVASLLGLGTLAPVGDAAGSTYLNPNGWQDAQKNALAKFQTDPGYQFRLNQGLNAVANSAAARGNTFSGAQAKALSDYGQGTASQEYGNYFNRVAGVSGLGETAATNSNAAYNQAINPGIQDQFAGSQAGAGYTAAGANALGAGIVGTQNALTSLAAYGGSGGKFGLPGWA